MKITERLKLDNRKGVIVAIREDEDMPVDKAGNRAEVVVSSSSTIDRSNWGRNFTPYYAETCRNLTKELLNLYGFAEKPSLEQVMMLDDALFVKGWERLMLLYAITSPVWYVHYTQTVTGNDDRRIHMHHCLAKKLHVFMPTNNPIDDVDAVLHLEQQFPRVWDKVYFREEGCDPCWSENNVRIAPSYFMLLEKIADQGSATNVGKLQHHGLLASQTRSEKYSLPYRPGPTRTTGGMESMLFLKYGKSPRMIAEILDRSGNAKTMRKISANLLRADKPTNVDVLVDRKEIPYGNTRPLKHFYHFLMTQGFELGYMTEEETFALGMEDTLNAR